jgi:hypothetical protein
MKPYGWVLTGLGFDALAARRAIVESIFGD